jgi:hypothetical protein
MLSAASAPVPSPRVRITYKSAVRIVARSAFFDTVDGLIAELGAGEVPKVEDVHDDAGDTTQAAPVSAVLPIETEDAAPDTQRTGPPSSDGEEAAPETPAVSTPRGSEICAVGQVRSEVDLVAARAAGFAPAQTLYTRGMRVIELGVDNARLAREEYDAKPTVPDACEALMVRVQAERRQTITVPTAAIGMGADGALSTSEGRFQVEAPAFQSLCTKLTDAAGVASAGPYLESLPPKLRAANVNGLRHRREPEARAAQDRPSDA